MKAFRVPGLIVVVGLLVGAVIIDRGLNLEESVAEATTVAVSSVAAEDALSSTWFCAAASEAAGLADSEIVLANTRPVASRAVISVFQGGTQALIDAPVVEQVLELSPLAVDSVRLADLAPESEYMSVAVEVNLCKHVHGNCISRH